jgi:hypothetical protein
LEIRRTMPGKLTYWIFTAITDTIAWNTLLRATFPKLFRQDLLVAPQSVSPSCQAHSLALDMAVDICLLQVGCKADQ